jgi:hypothetical protein
MLFNSYIFLLGFLPLVLLGFACLAGRYDRATVLFLVIASLRTIIRERAPSLPPNVAML